jgi:Mn2+/Fe2+ NRAMP family transporter
LDTVVGMAFSNLVALAIIVTSAATLNANGITDIDTASQAAEALRPIGTGLLAVPVLAGAAAYALAEARKWPLGLARQPRQAKAFYATIAVATRGRAMINFAPINPIKALIFSAVLNGVVAVPIMAIMMHMTANPKIMGKFTVGGGLRITGWAATIMMAAAALGLLMTS